MDKNNVVQTYLKIHENLDHHQNEMMRPLGIFCVCISRSSIILHFGVVKILKIIKSQLKGKQKLIPNVC